jgi:hypothetical protein
LLGEKHCLQRGISQSQMKISKKRADEGEGILQVERRRRSENCFIDVCAFGDSLFASRNSAGQVPKK